MIIPPDEPCHLFNRLTFACDQQAADAEPKIKSILEW
jgi:hypothetical protein